MHIGEYQNPWGQSSRHRRLNVQTSTSNARSPFRRRTVSPFDPTDFGTPLAAIALTLALAAHAAATPTPHEAVKNNHPDHVEAMLDAGADPNAKDEHGLTPLHWAISNVDRTIWRVRLLLDTGTDPNAKDRAGNAPLHWALDHDSKEWITKALLDAGADPNLKNKVGNSPLHFAARYGRTTAVEILLDAGADPNLKNKKGELPLDVARGKAKDVLFAYMLSKPGTQPNPYC